MIKNERGGTKYPRTGGTGENTPFAVQSRKKERDNGHDKDPPGLKGEDTHRMKREDGKKAAVFNCAWHFKGV